MPVEKQRKSALNMIILCQKENIRGNVTGNKREIIAQYAALVKP